MSSLTPNQLIALEAYVRWGGKFVDGIKEVRLRSNPDLGLKESKEIYEWADRSGIVQLALKLLPIHRDHTPGELAARTELSREEAERIIAAFPKPQPSSSYLDGPTHFDNWSSTAARKWLLSYARSLSSEAKYIRENADGFAENEEEFRCGLANGLGIDDEEEQTEIIRKFMEK